MQIVIDIPEEVKKQLGFGMRYSDDIQTICEAIANGTPLPKGHGHIVDGDEILIWMINKGIIDKLKCGEIASVFERATIIPADKEKEE